MGFRGPGAISKGAKKKTSRSHKRATPAEVVEQAKRIFPKAISRAEQILDNDKADPRLWIRALVALSSLVRNENPAAQTDPLQKQEPLRIEVVEDWRPNDTRERP